MELVIFAIISFFVAYRVADFFSTRTRKQEAIGHLLLACIFGLIWYFLPDKSWTVAGVARAIAIYTGLSSAVAFVRLILGK